MKTLKVILTTAFILIFCDWLAAQPGGRFPQVRERVSNVRLNQVAKRMNLEKERVEQLRPLYLKHEREKQELLDGRLLMDMRISPDSLTDEQAEQLFFRQMEKAKKMINLREKYFKEFRTVLSAQEILRFHRIEKQVNQKMMQQIRQRSNNSNRR
jgi:hypothetical protein